MVSSISKYLIFALWYIGIVFVVFAIYMNVSKKRGEKINKSAVINKQGKNKLYVFYRIFNSFPGFKRVFHKILRQTEMMYPSDQMSVNKEATKITLKALGIALGISLFSLLTCKGDLLFACMGILAGLVVFSYSITSTFDKLEKKLLEQMRDFLSDVRSHYINKGIVEDAIEDTLDEIPYEIGLHINKIYDILVSPIMEIKVDEYAETAPNRFFLLLLSICSSIKEYGGDNFLDSLSYLKEEINVEVLKKNSIKENFSMLQPIALVVVIFLKPIEIWAISNMPELESFYSGSYGQLLLVAIFIISFVSYFLVNILRSSGRGELVRTSVFEKISNIPVISRFLNKLINRRYTKARILNEKQKEVGDHTGPKAFMTKQIVTAIAAFLLINTIFMVGTIAQKLTMLNNYVAEFDASIVPNERYANAMSGAASDALEELRKNKNTDTEALKQQIMASSTITNETYAEMVAEEVIREYTEYKNTYFRWYYLVISILCGIIAYNIPVWFLHFKCKVANMNKEDEVSQFQTLALILMNVDGMRVDILLEWMERFAYSFKASIEDCIISLESGEREALETLKNSEDHPDFRRFVDCLLAIDESDVKSAFSEIIIDRNYSIDSRKQKNEFDVKRKSGTAKTIAFAPLMVVLIGYLLTPMTIMAIKTLLAMDLTI